MGERHWRGKKQFRRNYRKPILAERSMCTNAATLSVTAASLEIYFVIKGFGYGRVDVPIANCYHFRGL